MTRGFRAAQSRYDRQLPEDGDVPVGKCPSGGPTCEGDTNKSEISADEDGSSLDFLPCDDCATACEICGDDMGDHFVECVCGTDDKHRPEANP